MRSSIACIRCRRSKVKCVNTGVGTTCRSCEHSGRECLYPSPITNGGARRRDSLQCRPEPPAGEPSAKRVRKSTNVVPATNLAPAEPARPTDLLDPALLTPHLWQELFDIFQVHYATDLSFIHPPTFIKPLRYNLSMAGITAESSTLAPRPPASTEFLLAFLALTARFHPKLVAHHVQLTPTLATVATSPRSSDPLIASEYYGRAAHELLSRTWLDSRSHSLERLQAMLMLAFYEWSMCRGSKAWTILGIAIRSAQSIGLHYERDLDDEPTSRLVPSRPQVERLARSDGAHSDDNFIQHEIRRRTWWSCFILERYLSSGKYRPKMIHSGDLRIQLPASDRSFVFAEKVRTLMLGEDDRNNITSFKGDLQQQRRRSVMLGARDTPDSQVPLSPRDDSMRNGYEEKDRVETGASEGLLSKYIKILDIYGKVVKWSCMGGRRTESAPPWDLRGHFSQLSRLLDDFKMSLPRQETLSPQNTQAHISVKTFTPYVLTHMAYLLCRILLHREYLPFVPLRSARPEGPMDPSASPMDKFDIPVGYWEESARTCFRSARAIVDLLQTCQEWNAVVETPIVGYAIYNACLMGIYALSFPKMDSEGYMCSLSEAEHDPYLARSRLGGGQGFEALRKALSTIIHMRPRLRLANDWVSTIARAHRYYNKIAGRSRRSSSLAEGPMMNGGHRHSSGATSILSAGSLEELRLIDRTLKDANAYEDEDVDMSGMQIAADTKNAEVDDDSIADKSVKSEDTERRLPPRMDQPRPEGAWSAINTAPSTVPSRSGSISTPSGAPFRSYESYPLSNTPGTPQSGLQPNTSPGVSTSHYRSSISEMSSSRPILPPPGSHISPTSASPQHPTSRHHSFSGWSQHHSPNLSLPPPLPSHQHHTHSQPPNGSSTNSTAPPPSFTQQPSLPSIAQAQQTPQTASNILPPFPYHNTYLPAATQPQPQHSSAHRSVHLAASTPVVQTPQPDAWVDAIDMRFGGDDLAAFVDGGEWSEWCKEAGVTGLGVGWLVGLWS